MDADGVRAPVMERAHVLVNEDMNLNDAIATLKKTCLESVDAPRLSGSINHGVPEALPVHAKANVPVH